MHDDKLGERDDGNRTEFFQQSVVVVSKKQINSIFIVVMYLGCWKMAN